MTEWYHYPMLIGIGFLVGGINTIAGGGSLISLPILIFLGLPPSVANGTNRVAVVVQNALGSAGFASKGVTTAPFNIYLGISALLGALLGAHIAVDISEALFNRILAGVMIVVVFLLLLKPKMRLEVPEENIKGKRLWTAVIAFFFIGIYGGFINAGIGFIIILFLHHVNRMTLVRANATKTVAVLLYTLAALTVFVINDKVAWDVGAVLAIGNGSGAWFASRFSVGKGDGFVNVFLIIMIIILSIKLWFYDL